MRSVDRYIKVIIRHIPTKPTGVIGYPGLMIDLSVFDLEKKLWQSVDMLSSKMDAGESKHVVLGFIFLKYISEARAER